GRLRGDFPGRRSRGASGRARLSATPDLPARRVREASALRSKQRARRDAAQEAVGVNETVARSILCYAGGGLPRPHPMARTAGSDGTRPHEAIRQAAIALIADRGFAAMTLRELAARVGLQPGPPYRHFPRTNPILLSLMIEHLEFLLGSWQREQPDTTDPRARLRAFVDFHVRSHTLRRREVFVANMELRSLAPADRRRVVALRRRYEDGLTEILRAGVE